MNEHHERAVSRRVLLAGAATGLGMLGVLAQPAFAQEGTSIVEIDPMRDEGFLRAMPGDGVTDLKGVHAEYLEAVAAFPFALPPGFTFPANSRLTNAAANGMKSDAPVVWQRGSGYAEVFMYWQGAMVTAALNAHSRGDQSGANRLLDSLQSGYDSDLRRLILDDPDNAFMLNHVAPARQGDFGPLGNFSLT